MPMYCKTLKMVAFFNQPLLFLMSKQTFGKRKMNIRSKQKFYQTF